MKFQNDLIGHLRKTLRASARANQALSQSIHLHVQFPWKGAVSSLRKITQTCLQASISGSLSLPIFSVHLKALPIENFNLYFVVSPLYFCSVQVLFSVLPKPLYLFDVSLPTFHQHGSSTVSNARSATCLIHLERQSSRSFR